MSDDAQRPDRDDDTPDADALAELEPEVPPPGFSVTPPPAERPGFDPSLSPLDPAGRPESYQPLDASARLIGLTKPWIPNQPKVVFRVGREQWDARRAHARSRFGTIARQVGSSTNRLLAGLQERKGGILDRTKARASRGRLNLRRKLRG